MKYEIGSTAKDAPYFIRCSEVGAVLLVGVSISRGYSDKKQFQRPAGGKVWRGL